MRRSAIALMILTALTLTGCAGTDASRAPEAVPASEATSPSADIATLESPVIVSHRGAAEIHPEQSIEGFRASAEDGFLPEMDLRALAGGTLVPAHDEAADRTMRHVDGPISSLTSEDWAGAEILSPDGSYAVSAPDWEEVLDAFGGEIVLVPELKVADADAVATFIASVTERGLQESIVAQSFDRDTTRTLADAGLTTLRLLGEERPNPAALVADGVAFVGPPADVSAEYVEELQAAGLRVWVYTVKDAADTREQLDKGADGVFSDDPWASAEAVQL